METLIRFDGNHYLLIGDLEEGGAIATKEQYKAGECSFAHLTSNGDILRFLEKIGTREDIECLGDIDAEVDYPIAIDNLMGGLIDPQAWADKERNETNI